MLGDKRKNKVKRTKHGMYRTPEHYSWYAMIDRCTNEKNDWYHRYGGRGIKVCDRWKSFINFYSDMGNKPSKRHSLDRIDNNGDYEPNNCRWATKEQQDNNKEQTVFLEINGDKKCITDWAASSVGGISPYDKTKIIRRMVAERRRFQAY